MMTVAQMMAVLSQYPENAEVLVSRGGDTPALPVFGVRQARLVDNGQPVERHDGKVLVYSKEDGQTVAVILA